MLLEFSEMITPAWPVILGWLAILITFIITHICEKGEANEK